MTSRVGLRTLPAVGALLLVAILLQPSPGEAVPRSVQQGPPGIGDIQSITLIPQGDSEISFGRWRYAGDIEIVVRPDGLAVVERTPLDGYLAGVREVPLSWPIETLKAQAVAARTYLAWTLERGGSSSGSAYGYDICATTQCQVYAGTSVAAGPDGARWLDAVRQTADQILLAGGEPAQTLYSSSAGSRTRAIQDVFGGPDKPYLQPVDSPEAGVTPYERWAVTLDVEAFRRILARAGYIVGADVSSVSVEHAGEGLGPDSLVVISETGRIAIPLVDVRWIFNGHGQSLYPGLLPAPRPAGGRWPQAILSYTFDVTHEPADPTRPHRLLPRDDVPARGSVEFVGEGWGHGVGMSQWGAKALGDLGDSYDEILAHYYGGLSPESAATTLPDVVRVGLATRAPIVTVIADGSFEMRVNGVPAGVHGSGEWSFRALSGGILVVPPDDQVGVAERLATRRWPR